METSTELRELTLGIYQSFGKGDLSFIERLMTRQDGALAIGTSPDEWWAGYDAIVKGFRPQEAAFVGSSTTGDPQAYTNGDVGWVAVQGKVVMADGTEIPMRITLVFEKEAGEWKIVQWHASVGIPNVDAGFGDI